MVFNTVHAVAALAGIPLLDLLRDRHARLLWAAMIREGLEVENRKRGFEGQFRTDDHTWMRVVLVSHLNIYGASTLGYHISNDNEPPRAGFNICTYTDSAGRLGLG